MNQKLKEKFVIGTYNNTHTYPGFWRKMKKNQASVEELEKIYLDADRAGSLGFNIHCFNKSIYAVPATGQPIHGVMLKWKKLGGASASIHTGIIKCCG